MNNDIAKDAAEPFVNGVRALNQRAGFTNEGIPEYRQLLEAAFREAIQRATAADKERIASLEAWQKDVTEREGACCPEDVGFDEYISRLERKLAAKTQECEGLRAKLEELMRPLDTAGLSDDDMTTAKAALIDSARKEGE